MSNPASYTPTTWVNGTTPITADNLNNIENGMSTIYANAGQTGGANTWTGLQTDQVTLGGSDQKVHSFKATDGKTYSYYIRGTSGNLALRNDTDGIWLMEIDKHDGIINPVGTTFYVGTSDPAGVGGNTVSDGDVWIDG